MKKGVKSAIAVDILNVHNMAIYTRTGDDGTTGLYGGTRVSKTCVQVEAYGALDELTTTLGIFITYISDKKEARFIEDIQRDLYVIMGFLANAPTELENQKDKVVQFENKIDALTTQLPPLTSFIIPGGSKASSWAHMARVSCRNAERVVILHLQKEKSMNNKNSKIIRTYLNRLSDLLFIYARIFNENKDILSKKI